jgi:formylmethanofuran dehydrogenase subunit E
MESIVPYYADEHSPKEEARTRELFRKAIEDHMAGHVRIHETTPYEKCEKCGEYFLWEKMHMIKDDVYCEECAEDI